LYITTLEKEQLLYQTGFPLPLDMLSLCLADTRERRGRMAVSTPKEFLDKVLPESFDPDKAAGLSAVVQFKISGENGGEWVLAIKDQKLEVTDGTVDNPNMTLIMKDKDYVNLVNGKLSGQKAFMTGKLTFKGDMNLGMKLQALGLI
jgi:putative sterol carrier protein